MAAVRSPIAENTADSIFAPAPSYVVTTISDIAPGAAANCLTDGPSGGTGGSCSLRDALAAANLEGGGTITFDEIVFAASQPASARTITLGSAGTLNIPSNTAILGATAGSATNLVTVNGNNLFTVFTVDAGATATISGLTITNGNAGSGSGGAIFNSNDSTITMSNDTLSGNTASNGGGIYNNGTLTVSNSTLSGNTASDDGGGIYNEGATTVSNSTLSGNTASDGGGIFSSGSSTVILTNTIAAGNSQSSGGDCDGCGTQDSYNLISTSDNIIDLLLSPLQSNGISATLQTMMPLPGSPAIQAGDPSQLPAGTTIDERGFPRQTNSKLDLGAVQTNYTAVLLEQQPTDSLTYLTFFVPVTVEVLEINTNLVSPNNTDAVNVVPVTLTFSGGSSEISGTLTQTTSGGVATFNDLSISTVGTNYTLATNISVTPTFALSATSGTFNVTPNTITTLGTASQNAGNSYGQPVTLIAYVDTISPGSFGPPAFGSVTFYEGGTVLGTATLSPTTSSSSAAQFVWTARPLGQDTLTATYTGNPGLWAATVRLPRSR